MSITIYRFAGLLGAVVAAALLAGCGPGKPSFKSVDVTGADFGRELKLTDHTGKPRTLADFQGKVVVVFFGFTQCPDVCPTTLVEMKAVKEKLGKDGERVQVLFVTVDPERDTPELLAKYVPAFDPTFIGLYGDAEATARTAKEFKVFYKKVPGLEPDQLLGRSHRGALHLRPLREAPALREARARGGRARARHQAAARAGALNPGKRNARQGRAFVGARAFAVRRPPGCEDLVSARRPRSARASSASPSPRSGGCAPPRR